MNKKTVPIPKDAKKALLEGIFLKNLAQCLLQTLLSSITQLPKKLPEKIRKISQ
ncbi:MAG: hypothetical protein H7196_04960 [candidate division SR1 bacterium]|nr:hypothetical protein [candidate division SR1 bacterium]